MAASSWVTSWPEQRMCEIEEEKLDHRGLACRMQGSRGEVREVDPGGTQSLH